ncbi:ATP-binding protein [Phenylobacterium sp.]|uniref:ATP-binding protein n=1 Tax=Phenylobacterium sp. TaxID=1871053 RepID=UPI00391E012E
MAAQNPASARADATVFLRILLLAATVAALAYFGLAVPRDEGRVAMIWLANAPVLACLLRTPMNRWWICLSAGFAGNVAADLLTSDTLVTSVALSLCNALETALAAAIIGQLVRGRMDPTRSWHLVANTFAASLAALVAGLAAATVMGLRFDGDFLHTMMLWAVADALGLAVLTPCILILLEWPRWMRERRSSAAGVLALAGLVAADLAAFAQDAYPLSFLVPPAMLLVCLTLEVRGAAIGVILTSAIAILFTFSGHGSLVGANDSWTARLIVLQLFLVVNSGLAFRMAGLHRRRRLLQAELEHAREEAEAQAAQALTAKGEYRLLAERVTDVISRARVSGELTYVSPSIGALTGFRPEELLGRDLLPHVHPEDRTMFVEAHTAMAAGRRAGGPIRYRIIRKDGRAIWIEGNPSLVRDEAGRPVEFVDVSRDVTEQVELEGKLEAAVADAERAAKVKSEFLANMSHEIRTPLTSILGFASFLDEMKLADPAGRYAGRVVSASRTLLAVVNDILDFSKLEAGRLELKPRPTDPSECVRDVLELFGPQAEAKGLDLAPDVGSCGLVMVDPDRLRQVLMNLAGNAVKFTSEGLVRIACAYDRDAERLTFRVSDTGPGLGAEAQAKLFQRFSQVDGSTTRAHGGTGLGLAISKGLVEAMGGRIGVESRLGRGSTFWFEVPAPAAGAQSVAPEAAPELDALSGVRILAVDDNPQNLEIVRSILRPLGVELTEAGSGAQAVEAAKIAPFDLILMDLRMPEVDGWAAAGAIRDGDGPNRDAPILAFSADVAPDRRGAMGVFQDLVRKPIEPLELLRAILKWTLPASGEEDADHAAA